MPASNVSHSHSWRFSRTGGTDQVRLETTADLLALEQLDQKLWGALACPVRGLEFDTKTLEFIDTDKDGRVRAPEILAAIKWCATRLKNFDSLIQGSNSLALEDINEAVPEGKLLLASIRQILQNLGKPGSSNVTLADTADTLKILAQTKFNGDGVIPVESGPDETTKTVISEIIACLGSTPDRSGLPGINKSKIDQFFAELQIYSDWWKKAEETSAITFPFGDETAGAYCSLQAVRPKVDDYFARCRIAAFDARAGAALNRAESEFAALLAKDISAGSEEIAGFPLARIEPNQPLPLLLNINPAWASQLAQFRAKAVTLMFAANKDTLTAEDWELLKAKYAAYEGWLKSKPPVGIEKLGLPRIREILGGPFKETLAALMVQDKALEPEITAFAEVERLLRYNQYLFRLLNNFVSFSDFYSGQAKAIFQVGTLYLDGRSCELCVRVDDMTRHPNLASLARTFLVYCDCIRRGTGEKMLIAAAFTDGDSDDLIAGRNGIFYDRQGRDWDATIVKLIDHPISIRQAFWAPYKRIGRMVEEQIEKFAASRDKAVTAQAAGNLDATVKAAETGKPVDAPKKVDPGILAAVGIVTTGLVSAVSTIAAPLLGLSWWKWPFVVAGLMLVVSLPSMIIAGLKLRKRQLGPILDANGWAVNSKVKINLPFGGSLTHIATLPPNSRRDLVDPFAEDNAPRRQITAAAVLVVILLALWYFGVLQQIFPMLPKSPYLRQQTPAIEQPAKAPPK